jgi:hypothetical protein
MEAEMASSSSGSGEDIQKEEDQTIRPGQRCGETRDNESTME